MTRGVGGHSPANIAHHLKGIDFPASKQDLEKHAKSNGADKAILETIRSRPDSKFETMADVMKAYGKEHGAFGATPQGMFLLQVLGVVRSSSGRGAPSGDHNRPWNGTKCPAASLASQTT